MDYSIDYSVILFWLIVFSTVFGICGITETIQENRRKRYERFNAKVHRRVSRKVRYGYGARV